MQLCDNNKNCSPIVEQLCDNNKNCSAIVRLLWDNNKNCSAIVRLLWYCSFCKHPISMGVNYVILKLWNPSVDHIVLLLGPDLCPDMMVRMKSTQI